LGPSPAGAVHPQASKNITCTGDDHIRHGVQKEKEKFPRHVEIVKREKRKQNVPKTAQSVEAVGGMTGGLTIRGCDKLEVQKSK
jgi:hypothetical protein